MDRISELEKQLEQEREKVKGLHEITKVICTHCCEPMEIPSKAVLQTQLTQLQALVRALPVVSEVTSDTVVNLVQQYSFHAWMLRALQLRATLDATTPAAKGGNGE